MIIEICVASIELKLESNGMITNVNQIHLFVIFFFFFDTIALTLIIRNSEVKRKKSYNINCLGIDEYLV